MNSIIEYDNKKVYKISATNKNEYYITNQLNCRYIIKQKMVNNKLLMYRGRLIEKTDDPILIIQSMAIALHHLYKAAIIHRDIKMDNIIMYEIGNKIIPVLIDFAYSTESDGKSKSTYVYSRRFRPPELRDSVEKTKAIYDTRCDIWAFGILIKQLLTYFDIMNNDLLRKGQPKINDDKYKSLLDLATLCLVPYNQRPYMDAEFLKLFLNLN